MLLSILAQNYLQFNNKIMQHILNPDKIDLIRETIIILFGVLARWYELRKIKRKANND